MCPYRELLLWRQAISLAQQIYEVTRTFPLDDRGDLAERLRTSASAIPWRIAIHYSCNGAKFLRGLRAARRDLLKLEHLVAIANRLHYWSAAQALRMVRHLAELRRQIAAFLHSLTPRQQTAIERCDQRPTTNDQRPTTNDQ